MNVIRRLWRRPLGRYVVTALLLLVLGTGAVGLGNLQRTANAAASSTCKLNSANGVIPACDLYPVR